MYVLKKTLLIWHDGCHIVILQKVVHNCTTASIRSGLHICAEKINLFISICDGKRLSFDLFDVAY